MHFPEVAPNPLALIRLRGSQAQMGRQLGEIFAELGGWEPLVEFYPHMASRLLMLRMSPRVRRLAAPLLQKLLWLGAGRMDRYRERRFPEYLARTHALVDVVNVDRKLTRWMQGLDVMQNCVSLVARANLGHSTALPVVAVPACSSMVVWGSASEDGELRHARNFDFPGSGVWDLSPAVVLCEPDDGLRYGFVTTRGADAPGVTAFNEAGLTLTINSRFHRDIHFQRASAMDIGHEVIRRSRTLDDALRVAKGLQAASTWGFLVSSAAERDAILLETTAAAVEAFRPPRGVDHLASTNRYKSPSLHDGELVTSAAYPQDSNSRHARLEAAVREAGERGLSRADLERLLGDLVDVGAQDGVETPTRLAGSCITSPVTVKSVVSEPEQRQIRVSVGRAPTGFGPYVTVPWDWDGEVGLVDQIAGDESERGAFQDGGRPLSASERQAILAYVEATRLQLEGAPRQAVRELLELAVARAPDEPHFRFLAAVLALSDRDLTQSIAHLRRALALEAGPYRRALLLLWWMRVNAANGDEREAEAACSELLDLRHPDIGTLQSTASKERKRPRSAANLAKIVPDMLMVDG